MNVYLRWFRRVIWIGLALNLVFALPALLAPRALNAYLGLPMGAEYPWLNNTGMLLLGVSLFYLPAAVSPARWFAYSWLCAASRLIAVIFWIWLVGHTAYPAAFTPLMYTDGAMFVLLATLLQLGLPAEGKVSLSNAGRCLTSIARWPRNLLASPRARKLAVAVLVVVAFVGFETWLNLFRVVPQPAFESDVEHFKYAPIGLAQQSRLPLYPFEVMPRLCSRYNDGETDWSPFGFVFEGGREWPIGLAQRQSGYPSVEPTCSLCHTGAYQASEDDVPQPILAGPAYTLDLEKFQRFLYACGQSEEYSVDNVMDAIEARHDLGFVEGLFYRYIIVPAFKSGITKQAAAYAWQYLRPTQGPGRTDTFNPTKMVVFGFPDDSSIGTVDLPQIWNQQPREGMWLHWDGDNNAIKERNYAAAMAVGATPDSVLPENFTRITDWLLTKAPAEYPFGVDTEMAAQGEPIWMENCSRCHDFGKVDAGQVTTNIRELGTDRYRLDSFTQGLVDKFHTFRTPPFDFLAYRKTQSYSNTPTDGIWARAPYLHNGSVPTLWDLLQPPEARPVTFYRGYTVYDPVNVGYVSTGNAAENGFLFDTRLPGNSNSGHLYGTDLSEDEKRLLIEYMKTQ